jgi:polyisoprenyl-teichoic acid--peptidoglycan teichoic acid transferase
LVVLYHKGVLIMDNRNSSQRMRRRRRRKKPLRRLARFVLFLSILFFASAVAYGGFLAYKVKTAADDSYQELKREKSDLRETKVTLGEDPVNILLMGVESYKDSPGHSDALILLTVNPKTKETAMVSIPRDTRTYLPIIDRKDKIGHSYAYGEKGNKEQATIEAVEELMDVPIDYYVRTNFKGFQEIVDEVGGITVDVPFKFSQVSIESKTVYFKKGPMELNGIEALTYAQMRKQDIRGDFGRQERQQQVIQAIADEALSIKSFAKAGDIIETLGDNVQTNITLREMFAFRNFYKELTGKSIERYNIKGEDQYIDDIYYYIPYEDSIDEISSELKRILEIEDEQSEDNNTEGDTSSNDEYQSE